MPSLETTEDKYLISENQIGELCLFEPLVSGHSVMMHLSLVWWESDFQAESFHDSVERCHYQRAWLVSSWLIRFRVGQVVLSGLPRSTSPPILWALGGSAVSMQSWTIKGKSCWPPAVLWESEALASFAYLDQSGYKWTFTSRQLCKDSPEPSSDINLFNIPISTDQNSEREVLGSCIFPFKRVHKIHWYVLSGFLTQNVYDSNLDWLSEKFSPKRPCRISDFWFVCLFLLSLL